MHLLLECLSCVTLCYWLTYVHLLLHSFCELNPLFSDCFVLAAAEYPAPPESPPGQPASNFTLQLEDNTQMHCILSVKCDSELHCCFKQHASYCQETQHSRFVPWLSIRSWLSPLWSCALCERQNHQPCEAVMYMHAAFCPLQMQWHCLTLAFCN